MLPEGRVELFIGTLGFRSGGEGGTHYYQGQPELLREAVELCLGWMSERGLRD